MTRKIIFFIIRMTLIPFLVREIIQRKRVTIILYHDIKPETADKHFKILKSAYNIITLKDFIDAKKRGNFRKLPRKSLIITFDDGHKNNYNLKPILEKHKIPVTIFLCSSIVDTGRHFWFKHDIDKNSYQHLKRLSDSERLGLLGKFNFDERKEFNNRQALSKYEIETMKKIVDFQSHTMFHPILTRCFKARAFEEIAHSKKELENKFGFKIYALSYPNGDYSDREISMARNIGYECGITLDLGFNSQYTDIFRLKRICVSDRADINELIDRVSGVWDFIKINLKGQFNMDVNTDGSGREMK